VVLEGDLVNLGVTSPAAALALGLMYLQTNDAEVAAAFLLPSTHFALDYVQPEQLTLRLLMRCLGGCGAVACACACLLIPLPLEEVIQLWSASPQQFRLLPGQ
jgi:hypothetical protein